MTQIFSRTAGVNSHDDLQNVDPEEHLDWTVDQVTNDVHPDNVPTVPESAVTVHQAALSITESQISDLQSYLQADGVVIRPDRDLVALGIGANIVFDGSDQSAATAVLAAWMIGRSVTLEIPAGTWRCDTRIDWAPGDGDAWYFRSNGGCTVLGDVLNSRIWDFTSTPLATALPTTKVGAGETVIVLDSAAGFSEGDFVLLKMAHTDDPDVPGSPKDNSRGVAHRVQIVDITVDTITLAGAIPVNGAATSNKVLGVEKLANSQVLMTGINFKANESLSTVTAHQCVFFKGLSVAILDKCTVGNLVEDVNAGSGEIDVAGQGALFFDCMRIIIRDCEATWTYYSYFFLGHNAQAICINVVGSQCRHLLEMNGTGEMIVVGCMGYRNVATLSVHRAMGRLIIDSCDQKHDYAQFSVNASPLVVSKCSFSDLASGGFSAWGGGDDQGQAPSSFWLTLEKTDAGTDLRNIVIGEEIELGGVTNAKGTVFAAWGEDQANPATDRIHVILFQDREAALADNLGTVGRRLDVPGLTWNMVSNPSVEFGTVAKLEHANVWHGPVMLRDSFFGANVLHADSGGISNTAIETQGHCDIWIDGCVLADWFYGIYCGNNSNRFGRTRITNTQILRPRDRAIHIGNQCQVEIKDSEIDGGGLTGTAAINGGSAASTFVSIDGLHVKDIDTGCTGFSSTTYRWDVRNVTFENVTTPGSADDWQMWTDTQKPNRIGTPWGNREFTPLEGYFIWNSQSAQPEWWNGSSWLTIGGGGAGINNVVEDLTPQLGGMLDVNGFAIGNGTEELLSFTENSSAVNHLNVTNAVSGTGPGLTAVGDDANIGMTIAAKGTGQISILIADLEMISGDIILTSGTVDGRNVGGDGTKLDGIEALADVTDAANVDAAGAVMESDLTTKGDIVTRDASVVTRLGVGTDGQVLTADSAEPTGVKWGTPGGDGDMLVATYDPGSVAEQLVGLDASQTLTNKTLTGPVLSSPQINDTSSDHQYVLGVSELAADVVVTLPLLAAGDTFVFEDHTQVLTNKTIDAASNTLIGVGDVSASGTPVDNQLAVWTDASTIEGDANLTYDGTTLHVIGVSFPVALIERTTASTTGGLGTTVLRSTSSGNMTDDFGPEIGFQIEDTAAVANNIGAFSFVRDGADNSGAFVVFNYLAGVKTERLRIDSAGSATLDGTMTVVPSSDGPNSVVVQSSGASDRVELGTLAGVPTWGSVTLGGGSFTLAGNATDTVLNAPAAGGSVSIRTGNGSSPTALQVFNDNAVFGGTVFLAEQAAALADATGYGQLWAKTDGTLWFTNDAGTDTQLGVGGGGVSASGTPVDNQLAVWTDASTIEGTSFLELDANRLQIVKDHNSFTGLRATNVNTGISASALVGLLNDSGYASFELFGSNFSTASLQNTCLFTVQNTIVGGLKFQTEGAHEVVFATNSTDRMAIKGTGEMLLEEPLFLAEQAAAAADVAGYGQLWCKTDGTLWFTNEAGTDTQLGVGGGGSLSNIVEDTTPQLGGMLDVNGQALGDGTLELLKFVETGSAVNELTITNAATGGNPSLAATGDDADIQLDLSGKGVGRVRTTSDLETTGHLWVAFNLHLDGATSGTITLSAPAVAGTNTLTLPAATDTLVGKATTDTLTNKTFDANGTGNSVSNIDVADLANGTDGELITWDASGVPATVPVGTATHVLTSNGTGAAPTFQAIPGVGEDEVTLAVIDYDLPLTTGDGKFYFRVTSELDNKSLTSVAAAVGAAKSDGGTLITITLTRMRAASAAAIIRTEAALLSTALTIENGEWDSKDAAAPAVIVTDDTEDVNEGDLIRVDLDQVGTNAKGLFITLGFS